MALWVKLEVVVNVPIFGISLAKRVVDDEAQQENVAGFRLETMSVRGSGEGARRHDECHRRTYQRLLPRDHNW